MNQMIRQGHLREMLTNFIHCETLRGQVAHMNPCRGPCGIPKSAPFKWITVTVAFVNCLCKNRMMLNLKKIITYDVPNCLSSHTNTHTSDEEFVAIEGSRPLIN